MASEILLESGTNEFEIVEFMVGKITYGINVAKVREVINLLPVTKMPSAHPFIDGVFTLRGKVIPLVNLATCLSSLDSTPKRIIVAELNNYQAGFLVDEVSRIYRISWERMEPAPEIANSNLVVGIIKMEEKMIVLLDFERILSDISPEINRSFTKFKATTEEGLLKRRGGKTIVVAEDSHLLRELLDDNLRKAGYVNIIETSNGKDAWEILKKLRDENDDIFQAVQLVITDIEMPQMDGHRLLKLIREDSALSGLPVIVFSSLINEENRLKGESLGATAQVSKPEITELIGLIDANIK
ncbi:MAG: chemotaxis protein [Acidaminococcales bacterium]|nr:chemotaxis protein [Acidaminococcales bacterium]